jgi:hypothetical protein
VAAELDRSQADDRNPKVFGENRVEFGDSARPRVQVVAGNTVNHRCVSKLFGKAFILPDQDIRRNTADLLSDTDQTRSGRVG